jgi:hypothetical protein
MSRQPYKHNPAKVTAIAEQLKDGRRNPVIMANHILNILEEHNLTALPKNEDNRIAILTEAKQRYTKVKQ